MMCNILNAHTYKISEKPITKTVPGILPKDCHSPGLFQKVSLTEVTLTYEFLCFPSEVVISLSQHTLLPLIFKYCKEIKSLAT